MNVVQGETMADTYYRFHHTPEQQRRFGARGGRAASRNRCARIVGASPPAVDKVTATEPYLATTASDIAALDAQFPWLRGAEMRLPTRSPRRMNPHRTRALTAEREKPMQESIPGGMDFMILRRPP